MFPVSLWEEEGQSLTRIYSRVWWLEWGGGVYIITGHDPPLHTWAGLALLLHPSRTLPVLEEDVADTVSTDSNTIKKSCWRTKRWLALDRHVICIKSVQWNVCICRNVVKIEDQLVCWWAGPGPRPSPMRWWAPTRRPYDYTTSRRHHSNSTIQNIWLIYYFWGIGQTSSQVGTAMQRDGGEVSWTYSRPFGWTPANEWAGACCE